MVGIKKPKDLKRRRIMRFDIIGEDGRVIYYAHTMKEALSEVEELNRKGRFNLEKPKYIRSDPFMTYKYYNIDGTENYEETKKHLEDAGYGEYLK